MNYITDRAFSICGYNPREDFSAGDRRISTASCSSANKENTIPTVSKNCTKTTGPTTVVSPGLVNQNVAQAQDSTVIPISVSSADVVDCINKDSLLLTELMDGSDDEWANTCILETNGGLKVSSTSTSTALCSSGSRISSVASTTFSQQVTAALPFRDKPNYQPTSTREINNFNSSFDYPQRTNTIPNNGDDSKLAVWLSYFLYSRMVMHPGKQKEQTKIPTFIGPYTLFVLHKYTTHELASTSVSHKQQLCFVQSQNIKQTKKVRFHKNACLLPML